VHKYDPAAIAPFKRARSSLCTTRGRDPTPLEASARLRRRDLLGGLILFRSRQEERLFAAQWFNLAGILNPSPLEPDIDVSALIGYPAAQTYLGYVNIVRGERKTGPPSSIYVRAATGYETAVQALLAQTADPAAPYEAAVSQPSDVLTARAAAAGRLTASSSDSARWH
jgi:hypothetical protein